MTRQKVPEISFDGRVGPWVRSHFEDLVTTVRDLETEMGRGDEDQILFLVEELGDSASKLRDAVEQEFDS